MKRHSVLSSLSSLAERVVDLEDRAFVESLVQKNCQEIHWLGWVRLYTKGNANSKKDRVLCVSSFRLFTVKNGMLGRSTRQSFAIMELTQVIAQGTEHVHFNFGGGNVVDIEGPSVVAITRAVLMAFHSISKSLPPARMPLMELPEEYTDGLELPMPDEQDGILASYLAACDFLGLKTRLAVVDYLMGCFATDEHVFDLSDCLESIAQPTHKDIRALSHALAHNAWFTEIHVSGVPLKDEGVEAFSRAVTPNVTRLVLSDVKCGKAGMVALADQIGSMPGAELKVLNISNNPIGDAGIEALVGQLGVSGIVLETLIVSDCKLTAPGLATLLQHMSQAEWLKELVAVDLSQNSAGKDGTSALCNWLDRNEHIKYLYAAFCDLDMGRVLQSLQANRVLSQNSLRSLNLSGNKLPDMVLPIFCEILTQSESLSQIYFVNAKWSSKSLLRLVDACLWNRNVRFWIEMSGNNLGTKGAKELARMIDSTENQQSLHTLIINDCGLGASGVSLLCKSLTGKPIVRLSLDDNMKLGMFSSSDVVKAGQDLAEFVAAAPTLRELSVAADDAHYVKDALHPLLEHLRENTHLHYLNVSGNRLGDAGITLLAEALKVNTTLLAFTAERNRITIRGLQQLHNAILVNETIVDWEVPMQDIAEIYKSATSSEHELLKIIVTDFDSVIVRNARIAQGGDDDDSLPSSSPDLEHSESIPEIVGRRASLSSGAVDYVVAGDDEEFVIKRKASLQKRHSRVAATEMLARLSVSSAPTQMTIVESDENADLEHDDDDDDDDDMDDDEQQEDDEQE